MKILLAEDETGLAHLIAKGLKAEGLTVEHTPSGQTALHRLRTSSYDAVVLDIMLRERDGLSVLRQIRRDQDFTPVIIITARDGRDERIEGLDAGADDYVTKPFFVDELTARLRAIWRRTAGQGSEILQHGMLRANLLTREACVGSQRLTLTAREFDLLVYLMRTPERVLNRAQIFESVWEYHFDPETNLVDVYVGRLRRKLAAAGLDRCIQTIRHVGYTLAQADDG